MKSSIIIICVVAVLLIAGGFFIFYNNQPAAQGNNPSDNTQTGGNSVNPDNTASDIAPDNTASDTVPNNPSAQTYNIGIKDFSFQPQTLRIKTGDTVVWTNQDSVQHTATSDSGGELNSKFLSKGQSYSHIFNNAGTYDYHCTPHPYMKGKVIVE